MTNHALEVTALKNAIQKLKKRSGFTLAETLMTVLILLMVSSVVAGGIPAAVTAYSKAVDAANAQVLISTTVNALRAELCTAKDVQIKTDENDQTVIFYISPTTGSKTKIFIGNDKDGESTILVWDFLNYDGTERSTDTQRRLVTKSAATKNLQIALTNDEEDGKPFKWAEGKENEVIVFDGLEVTKDGKTVASIDELYIRCLGVDLTQRTGG